MCREETRNASSLEPFSLIELVTLATLMRALTVLKETSFNLFGRVLPLAMVRAEPYTYVPRSASRVPTNHQSRT
jgi:hypothetical protein